MPTLKANGIEIAYERHGDPARPAVLLVMGLGGQLSMWPRVLVDDLVAAGYHVVRFDNRDIGLSAKFDGTRVPNIVAQMALRRIGISLKTPYTLADMANDTVGLMDGLGIRSAHLVGISMGGMIGQFVAASHPERIASFTALMTTTGNPKLPRPDRRVLEAIIRRGPRPAGREAIIAASVHAFSVIGTPGEDQNTNGMRDRIAESFDRNYCPSGLARQIAAIIATGDFRKQTRAIRAPTLVIHGTADPLVPPDGGKDIARLVQGARLELIEGMGHDIPPRFLPQVTRLMIGHMKASEIAAGKAA